MTALEARVARVHIQSDIPGSEVLIDESSRGLTPLSLLINPGVHEIRVRHTGHADQEKTVTFAEGAREVVSFTLLTRAGEPASTGVSAKPAPLAPRPAPAKQRPSVEVVV